MPTYEYLVATFQLKEARMLVYSTSNGRQTFPCPDAPSLLTILNGFGALGFMLIEKTKGLPNESTYFFQKTTGGGGGAALTDGNLTTANGAAADLGGTANKDTNLVGASFNLIEQGFKQRTLSADNLTVEGLLGFFLKIVGTSTGRKGCVVSLANSSTGESQFTDPNQKEYLQTNTANFTFSALHYVVDFDATAGAINATLPNATSAAFAKRIYIARKRDASANTITIKTTAGQTINGAADYTLEAQGDVICLMSDGSDWIILNAQSAGTNTLAGYLTLSAGTAVLSNAALTASSVVNVTPTTTGTLLGTIFTDNTTPGQITFTSSNLTDNVTFSYFITI